MASRSSSSPVAYKKYDKWNSQARFLRSGNNASRAIDKLVVVEQESVKRHNRLVDLKLEEEKRKQKEDKRKERLLERMGSSKDDTPTPTPNFGKEAVRDTSSHFLPNRRTHTNSKSGKRKYEETELKKIDDDFEGCDHQSIDEAKDKSEELLMSKTKKAKLKESEEEQPEMDDDQEFTKKQKLAGSIAEARARFEENQRKKAIKREQYLQHQKEVAEKIKISKQHARKMMQKTRKGQPVLKNILHHYMKKLEKSQS